MTISKFFQFQGLFFAVWWLLLLIWSGANNSLSVFKYFDHFQKTEYFGSDHSATLKTLKLKRQTEFKIEIKSQIQEVQHHEKVDYKASCLYPPKYPDKENLKKVNNNLIELLRKSVEQSYLDFTTPEISPETINLIQQKKNIRNQQKVQRMKLSTDWEWKSISFKEKIEWQSNVRMKDKTVG